MTYNMFGGTLSLTQSINQTTLSILFSITDTQITIESAEAQS